MPEKNKTKETKINADKNVTKCNGTVTRKIILMVIVNDLIPKCQTSAFEHFLKEAGTVSTVVQCE